MSVVVLNGASRGIGLALARQFLANTQLSVVTTARNPPQNIEPNQRWTHLSTDLTNEDSVRNAATAIKNQFGSSSIAVVVNIAGYLQPEKSIAAITPANLHAHFAINVIAPALTAKHMSPLLFHPARARSSPLPSESLFHHLPLWANVSARVGSIGDNRLGGWYSYRMSKAAQNQLTKSLSIELGLASKRDAVVVALHPGTVRTDLSSPYIGNVAPEKLFAPEDAAAKMFAVLKNLEKKDNGKFLDYAGMDIVW
ncbi:hypothetical protein HDU86_003948 [Geranomyces michiganensis]|nr:hypothetical protein HDU86_003948 [Geranomyces michiganensis]